MPYPSQAMRTWCENVEKLRQEMFRLGKAREDGWCQCQIGEALGRFCPQDQQAQFCSGLFWSIWIDQVFYSVSRHLGQEFYEQTFRPTYRFPKLFSHPTPGHASPAFLLSEPPGMLAQDWRHQRPSRELLLKDKEEFWGEVAGWLQQVERQDILQAAETDFKDDLQRRFPEALKFLFST